jgi:hypothetical protein
VWSGGSKIVWLILLATAGRLNAQVKLGDLNTDLSAIIAGGYTADYGNETASDHGFTASGSATLSGSYHDPNFLSFSVLPFYNESRADSGYQSITNASGVTANTSIFAGSNFPGSITYSDIFNSEGNFGFPGLPNYTTHGDSSIFGITWGAFFPNLPTLSVSYQQGSNDYSLYGAEGNSVSDFRTFSASSNYKILGFLLNGSYHYNSNQLQLPEILQGQSGEKSKSDANSYTLGIGHALPFNGSVSASASRSDLTADYTQGNYNATIDSFNGGVSFIPIEKLHIGANAQYLDNLTGSLEQAIIGAGGELNPTATNQPSQSSHSLDVTGYGNYEVTPWHTTFSVLDEHRDQSFFGQSFASNAVTVSAGYGNPLWGGFLTGTVGLSRTTITPGNISSLGLIASINYARQIRRWIVTTSVHYDQNAQTILVSYTTSDYGYSGGLARKFGRYARLNLRGTGAQTGLTNQPGSTSESQAYSGTWASRFYSLTGSYSRSSGNSILTASGLVPVPVPLPVVAPSSLILYGGHAYALGVGANPIRGLTISAAWSKSDSATAGDTTNSNNKSEIANAFIQYRLRKIYLNAGYSRLDQSLSAAGGSPVKLVSYYIGISRWFNFF